MRLITKIFERRKARIQCEKDVSGYGITFTWSDGRPNQRFAWEEVCEIATYKVDYFSYDVICLAFSIDDAWFEITEDDAIFPRVVEIVESKFPGVPKGWYGEVMFPPFKAHKCVLWSATMERQL